MNFIQIAFGKSINELTYADIVEYFSTPKSETDFSEFKSYDEKESFDENIKKIHRTLCGLLNSGGGFIIWGAPIGVTVAGQQEKVFTGNLKLVNQIIGKDRMVNKLADKITPLPNSFKVEVISNDAGDKSVCIIEVEKSNYSPHQFSNNYFMRIDGQTRPAPHHYIEALFKQIKFPNLEGYLGISSITKIEDGYKVSLIFTVINASHLQNEKNISVTIICSDNATFIETKNKNKFYSRGKYCQYKIFSSLLSFGELYPEFESIIVDDETIANNEEITIKFSFVGESTPRKESLYKLKLPKNLRINEILKLRDYSKYIKAVSENVLYSDTEKNGNVTSRSSFLYSIGRVRK